MPWWDGVMLNAARWPKLRLIEAYWGWLKLVGAHEPAIFSLLVNWGSLSHTVLISQHLIFLDGSSFSTIFCKHAWGGCNYFWLWQILWTLEISSRIPSESPLWNKCQFLQRVFQIPWNIGIGFDLKPQASAVWIVYLSIICYAPWIFWGHRSLEVSFFSSIC